MLNVTQKRKMLGAESWDRIRITMDYSLLNGTMKDKNLCEKEGQQVEYQGEIVFCTKDDILNNEKIKVIQGTLDNAKNFFERLLYVTPLNTEFELENHPLYFNYSKKMIASNTDFYITVVSRAQPEGSRTLAAAGAVQLEFQYYRPVQAVVIINPRSVPNEIQSEESWDNKFFYVCIHELTHALGFNGAWELFHPMESTETYQNPTCELTKYNRKFTFLVTPYAHIYAINRFGVEEFVGDDKKCPSGIEIEDMGGSGTKGSHLKGRVFFSELMQGVAYQSETGPFMRLTDATLAVLLDTGNYRINWTMASPLVFGHPESFNDENISEKFALEPPQKSFPDNYLNMNSADVSMFNFKNAGYSNFYYNASDYQKVIKEDAFPYYISFINPINYNLIGWDETADYQLLKSPDVSCPIGQAVIHGNLLNCYPYFCNKFDNFTMDIENNRIHCTKENIGQKFNITVAEGIAKVWCPSPERFCRTVKLHEMNFVKNPFIKHVKHLDPADQGQGPDIGPKVIHVKKLTLTGLILICVAVVVVIVVIIVGVVVWRKKYRNHGYDDLGGV